MPALLMVGAGSMGSGYVDAAVRRGYEVGLVERHRWTDTYRDRVSRLFPCAASTDEHWTAAAVAAAQEWSPDLVLGFAEPQVLASAWVQDALGLPGPGLRAAVASRDKALQRTLGATGGVPQPEFVLARDLEEARLFADGRYPVVVKALRSSGSLGVVSVSSPGELSTAMAGVTGADPVLVERQVDGPEYSCELLVRDGEVLFENYTRKATSGPPEFVEVAHVLPAVLPAAARPAVQQAVRAILAVLDVRTSLVHLEFRLDGTQPRVLETAVRTPGDRIMDLLSLAYGVDMHDEVLTCYRGDTARTFEAETVAAIEYLRPEPGKVESIAGAAEALALPGVRSLELPYKPGQIVADARSSGDRGGYVIVTGPSEDAVAALLAEVRATVRIATT